jgi:hypothetical protein
MKATLMNRLIDARHRHRFVRRRYGSEKGRAGRKGRRVEKGLRRGVYFQVNIIIWGKGLQIE